MLNIIQNTIGAIRRVGESVVRAGLKMWLPFTKAEPLGEELVVNGDFSHPTDGWDFGASTDIVGGKLVCTSSTSYNSTSQSISMKAGTYIVTYTIDSISGGVIYFGFDGVNGVNRNTPGTYTEYLEVPSNSSNLYIVPTVNGIEFEISNVSVEEYAQETPDISGNDNNAILKTGKALVFADNDSVETSFPSSKDIKTIAFWIYPTHSSTDEVVFYFGDAAGGDKYIDLDHLVMESDANNNINFDVYIDGVLRGETNYGGNNPTLTINQWQRVVLTTDTAINTTNDKFYIAHKENGAFGRFKMSDLQIYGADWTTDDIAYDYANPQKLVTDNASSNVTLNDLHAWWHMSEGDGTIAFDSAPLIGVDVVPNGDFSTDNISAISGAGTRSVENNKLKIQEDGLNYSQCIYYNLLDTAKIYKVTFDLTIGTGTYIIYDTIDGDVSLTDGSGGYTAYLTNTSRLYIGSNGAGDVWYLDNITAKEVFNIDGETYDGSSLGATYDDAQERIPQLGMMNWSKGSNLIEYSEDITLANGYGKNTAVTLESNAGVSPIGTGNATKMSNPSGYGIFYNTQSLDAAETYTFSFYVKNINATDLKYRVYNNTTQSDLISPTSYYSQTSTDEWVRVSITFTTTNSANYNCYLNSVSSGGSALFWGAQLEKSLSTSAYRRTNGTAVTDATLISCATDSQKDILGNAVRVKGSGFNLDGTGYAEVLDDASINPTTAITIGCWVYFEGNKTDLGIVGKWETNKNDYLIVQILDGSNRKLRLYLNTTDGLAIISSPAIVGDKWVYVACTYNKDAGPNNTKIYTIIPNNLDGSGNQIIQKGIGTHTGSINDSNNNITIGQYNYIGSTFFDNKIDDVKIYNTDLSEAQIEQNYNATKSGHNN